MEIPKAADAKKYFEQKLAFSTGPVELDQMLKEGDVNVIDVRATEDFEEGHIPKSINLPQERWETFEGLEKDKINVVLCYCMFAISPQRQRWNLQAAVIP